MSTEEKPSPPVLRPKSEIPPLFSLQSIGGATFLGGPFAAGVVLRRNFTTLGQSARGNLVFAVCAVLTLVLFGSIVLLPEKLLESIPNSVIPAIYTTFAVLFAKSTHGNELHRRADLDGGYVSGWKAFGAGLGGLIVSLIIAVTLTMVTSADGEAYNAKLESIQAADKQTLAIYQLLENNSDSESIIEFIDRSGLPALDGAIKVAQDMTELRVGDELQQQAARIKQYLELRREVFLLYRTEAEGNGNYQTQAIAELEKKIAELSL